MVAVGPVLLGEQRPGRQADYPGPGAFGEQQFVGLDREGDLAAAGDDDRLWRLSVRGVGENVTTPCEAGGRGIAAAG